MPGDVQQNGAFVYFLFGGGLDPHSCTDKGKYEIHERICVPLPIMSFFELFGDGSNRENVLRVGGPLRCTAAVDPMGSVRRYMKCLNPEN